MALTTLGPTISAAGISAPTYAEILSDLQTKFQTIYGNDVYIAPDSQDGQWLATIALAIHNQNDAIIAVFNAFSPTYAQGIGLSAFVKINGITRRAGSFSTANGDVVGQVGTVILAGVVKDQNGNLWNLPASVTIPDAGVITVTVTAQQPGDISALTGTIDQINTPTLGWQSFTSTTDALAGSPVESDSILRVRQATAASLPSVTPLAGVLSALQALPGVTRCRIYENDEDAPDVNGLPAHSISAVVLGGDVGEIVEIIGQKKTPGAATYGTESEDYFDPITGLLYTINFYVLAFTPVTVHITLDAGISYSSVVGEAIQQSVADYINGLAIGAPVQITRLMPPAYLNGSALGATYEITALTLNAGSVDVPIDFNKAASIAPADVTLTVT